MQRFDTAQRGWIASVVVTAIYGAIVVFAAAHHEPWRDEVVPLSIARHARALGELAEPLRFEGHPILWYLVLWCLYHLVAQTWVLKAASVGSAIGAVVLLNRSPLPWWLRWLVTFSFFPIYQYSVVSRGYSVEMLLVLTFCTLYPFRHRHPLLLATVLAALANTETFGFIIAVAAAAMLVVQVSDWRTAVSDRRLLAAAVVYLGGLALAAAVAAPAAGHPLAGYQQITAWDVVTGVGRAVARPGAHSAWAILPWASVWVWAYFAYLARRPAVLCFAVVALVGIEAFFNVVYGPRAVWHLGNVVLALVAAAWLDASQSITAQSLPPRLERARVWLGRVLAAAAITALAGQASVGFSHIATDVRYDYSANRQLAELLRGDPALAGAVVMGEPDAPLWSVPYYADNRIYLVREQTFRPWGAFGPSRARTYDLGALLDAARRMREQCGCPVVITLGWPLEVGTFASFPGTYAEERFEITAAARADFLQATRAVARLGPTITDENYDVYTLR